MRGKMVGKNFGDSFEILGFSSRPKRKLALEQKKWENTIAMLFPTTVLEFFQIWNLSGFGGLNFSPVFRILVFPTLTENERYSLETFGGHVRGLNSHSPYGNCQETSRRGAKFEKNPERLTFMKDRRDTGHVNAEWPGIFELRGYLWTRLIQIIFLHIFSPILS